MASPSYRYLTTHALTNKVLASDLPLTGVEFGPALSASGTLTGAVAPRLAHLVRSQLDPGNTKIYVERDGRLLWGGIVWRADPEGQQLNVEAAGCFDHWYSAAGGTATIRAHQHASRPARFSCDPEAMSVPWKRNQGKWVDISTIFDSVRWRGIALDPNSTSRTAYGRARGYGQTYAPRLRVTFTK
ncbi:hypothetical protein [Streptomyces sp. NPDC053367]|uniref:hypothetical protein n=1 Tax=Streptomyces sp. NPDC053367 TaxID=3365700 RepID=UPI0037D367B5